MNQGQVNAQLRHIQPALIDTACHMTHATGDRNDQDCSSVADLVATWEHRWNPSNILVKPTHELISNCKISESVCPQTSEELGFVIFNKAEFQIYV